MSNIILTSSFATVSSELRAKNILPAKASVAFIPTAGDIYPETPWIDGDRRALIELGYQVTDVDLKGKSVSDLQQSFADADIIFVAGGNTTYLLVEVQRSGFDSIVRDLLKQGKVYIGSSAGSILAGPSVEPFLEEDLGELGRNFVVKNPACLGLVDYIMLPHYPSYAERNDELAEEYASRFAFAKVTDDGYRVATL